MKLQLPIYILPMLRYFKCFVSHLEFHDFYLHPCRIGKQFELTLLLQSVVMIIAMFAMLHLCCTVQNTNRVSTKQHRLSGNYLWQQSQVTTDSGTATQLQSHVSSNYTLFQGSRSHTITTHHLCVSFQLPFLTKRGGHWKDLGGKAAGYLSLTADSHLFTTNQLCICFVLYWIDTLCSLCL